MTKKTTRATEECHESPLHEFYPNIPLSSIINKQQSQGDATQLFNKSPEEPQDLSQNEGPTSISGNWYFTERQSLQQQQFYKNVLHCVTPSIYPPSSTPQTPDNCYSPEEVNIQQHISTS